MRAGNAEAAERFRRLCGCKRELRARFDHGESDLVDLGANPLEEFAFRRILWGDERFNSVFHRHG